MTLNELIEHLLVQRDTHGRGELPVSIEEVGTRRKFDFGFAAGLGNPPDEHVIVMLNPRRR